MPLKTDTVTTGTKLPVAKSVYNPGTRSDPQKAESRTNETLTSLQESFDKGRGVSAIGSKNQTTREAPTARR